MNLPVIKDLCRLDSTDAGATLTDRINDLIDNQRVLAEVLARHRLVKLEYDLFDLPAESVKDLRTRAIVVENKFKAVS